MELLSLMQLVYKKELPMGFLTWRVYLKEILMESLMVLESLMKWVYKMELQMA